MFTPQQLEELTIGTQPFNGYRTQDVDEILENLINDYTVLYKENGLLKSKMRVLVAKLEEYRQNEASMKEAMAETQRTCDQMVKDAEAKCTQMLQNANQTAADSVKNVSALVEQEQVRVEEARHAATRQIEALQAQLRSCMSTLERIKNENRPTAPAKEKPEMFDVMAAEEANTHTIANTDSQSPESSAIIPDEAPKADPKPPVTDPTTSKFSGLKFGRNYDPDNK